MDANHLLLTAVSFQRNGLPRDEIETALVDLARRDLPDCHCRRDFAGHVEMRFDDGRSLRFEGGNWVLSQEGQVAPLYLDALAGFISAAPIPPFAPDRRGTTK